MAAIRVLPMASEPRWFRWVLLFLPILVAAVSARPFAGGWNDGSRLATVEALVDHGTLAIDDSIFVRVPAEMLAEGKYPYSPNDSLLLAFGTSDKLQIGGKFYSDKPAVISYLMAIPYQGWRWLGLPSFRERPDLVCYFLTLFTSGLVYAFSVWGINALGSRLRLTFATRMNFVAAFAFSTVALPYVRHVNNHILLMGVMVGLLHLLWPVGRYSLGTLIGVGTLLGIGYNLDLGLGPILLASTIGLVLIRARSLADVAIVATFAAPWVIVQLAINYSLGGVWKPVNTVPEYLAWAGSPFTAGNLTGFMRHDALKFVEYSLLLMFGKQGFIGHNLPLFLLLPALLFVVRPSHARFPEMIFGLVFCVGGWGMYSLFSNNYGGACCSIRWFVPFLVPGFFLVGELLKKYPQFHWDFQILAGFGALMGLSMWLVGPFTLKMVPLYWPIQIGGLLAWIATIRWRRRNANPVSESMPGLSPQTEFARAA